MFISTNKYVINKQIINLIITTGTTYFMYSKNVPIQIQIIKLIKMNTK